MKKTLFGRLTKLQGRISKFVKKSRDSRRFILTMIAVWTIIPALSVNAADSNVVPVEPIVTNVTVGQDLQIEQSKFSVEIRQSPRQIAKKQEEIRLATAIVQTPISSTDEEKRAWAQKAAQTWGIDWKLLWAVWKVESGTQMSTAVRSYAGAQGPLQFMPGTWRAYAQDGNGDGVKNINDARDSLFGAAKLLAVNGAASGNIDGALLRYNHSLSYVAHVKRIAASIGG
ncbi:MAG: lytic transglycosylase domain-containing protein [Candidatus Berkelbacteria bacterium]|nr:lytic transglycosylase domain-containing protein [Candidatus Berkelbacteria bacterium]